jgi:hypothetical protein
MGKGCWLSVALVILVSTWAGAVAGEEMGWKAGTARAKITPDEPLWMAGYAARDRPAEGTLHDIWIKVLALEDAEGRRAVVITSDVCGFSKISWETICDALKGRFGLDRSRVMLTCSHTHTGPALRECLRDYYPMSDEQRARNNRYTLELEETIAQKVGEALGKMTPAALFAAQGTTDFAVNRRNNRESEVPDLRERGVALKGPVDHDVPVLVVRTPEGALRAAVFSYACHTTTLSLNQWSGDYAGFAQIALEKNHPGMQAMFHVGCGADQNPMPRRKVEFCQKYGEMLAAAVEEVLGTGRGITSPPRKGTVPDQPSVGARLRENRDSPRTAAAPLSGTPGRPIAPTLQTVFEFVDLDFERVMTAEDLEGYAAKGGLYGRWARRMLKRLEEGETFATSYPYAVQVWKLGDQVWISLGGEVVVDYAIKFKAKYGPRTWVNGFAHDLTAYIPSRRVWEEGGYEGGALGEYGLPAMRWAPDLEDRITACVAKLVGASENAE